MKFDGTVSRSRLNSILLSIPLLLVALILVLLHRRDIYTAISPDLGRYERLFDSAYFFDTLSFFQNYRFEPGFMLTVKTLSSTGLNFDMFLIITQAFYFTALLFLLLSVTRSLPLASLTLLVALWLPTNQIMPNNALRQAWAMCFMFLLVGFILRKASPKRIRETLYTPIFIMLTLSGVLFHYSFLLVTLLIVVSLYFPKNLPPLLWIALSVFYCLNLPLIGGLLISYLYPLIEIRSTGSEAALETVYRLGFKSNFLIMSSVPMLIWLFISALRISISSRLSILYSIYFISNSFCLLLSLLPFHDRFFHYTWALIPVIALGTLLETAKRATSARDYKSAEVSVTISQQISSRGPSSFRST